MVQWKVISNSDITTTQTPLEIGIVNMLLNFQNICKLKDLGKAFLLKQSIAAYASHYRCGTRHYNLRITEKYIIGRADQQCLLNKRTEFISKCRHQNKFLLRNVE